MQVLPLLAAAAGVALYATGARRARFPAFRIAAFPCGAASAGCLIAWDPGSLAEHMVQHGLLTALAAPLLVLGQPVALALRLARAPHRVAFSEAARRLRGAVDPWSALCLFTAVQWLAHWPALLERAEARPLLHLGIHLLLLDAAILFYLPVLGRQPVPRRLRGGRAALHLALAIPLIDLISIPYVATGRADAAAAMLAAMSPLALLALAVAWRGLLGEEREMRRREALS
jgi:cytochrome c oxidase assembly factor CtaG